MSLDFKKTYWRRISSKVLIFLMLLFGNIFSVFAQISPGDLAEPHAHLEGISNCTLCHTLGSKVSDDKCLDCHKEIKARINEKKGYHSSKEVQQKSCIECHNDHHGRKFQIVRFDQKTFDHNLTGYQLEGAHDKLECNDCHQNKFISDAKIKEKKFTFLGMKTNCTSCHEDYHQSTLTKSKTCIDCHDFNKFKPATNFEHDRTAFKLLGKHTDVVCEKCHKKEVKNGKDFQVFNGVAYANCIACHADVHENKFGSDCKKCHTEQSFQVIKSTGAFNHNSTGFVLEGKHQTVSCKACHKNKYTDPIRHEKCVDCHNDYHLGQFDKEGKSTDCIDCHTNNGFVGSTYTIEKHAISAFPLKGAHIATPCFVCHKKTEKWSFRDIGGQCVDCHEDIHTSSILEKYYPEKNCLYCHEESRWNSILFDHKKTDFVLEGKHKQPSCRECHFKKDENGFERQHFAGLSEKCTNCHTDKHQQQFEKNGVTDCKKCHDFEGWTSKSFNHNLTRFPLEGKHAETACASCHKETTKNNSTYILYKLNDIRCEACH